MAVLYTPHFVQFFDDDGNPLSGGKLYTYVAGTLTPKPTYTTAEGDIPHTNPVELDAAGRAILFLIGSYKFVLHDADDNPIDNGTTDNVTAFNAITSTNEGFFQSFSGDGEETSFTLSENLGIDEKAIMVFTELEFVKNGSFGSDTAWDKGSGWTIGAGVATATGAISTALSQNAVTSLIEGKAYSVRYTITRSAGTITLSVGGTAGTGRTASGTYAETIIAGSTQAISFGTSGFTGTVDNVSITEIGGPTILNPNLYTVDGTDLGFVIPPTTGSNNILVFAPYTLIGAAGAAQVAADDAIAAAGEAEAARDIAVSAKDDAEAAEAAIARLDATSTSSIEIGTGTKTFTIDAGKGFIPGMWVLVTSDDNPTNYVHGYVSSYASTTLEVEVTNTGGSGTHDDWTIRLSGTRGTQGPAGSIGDITVVQELGGGSGTRTIDINNGWTATLTSTGNTTLAFSNVPASGQVCVVTLKITNGGAFTLAFPSGTRFPEGEVFEWTASGTDEISLLTVNGGTTWDVLAAVNFEVP